MSESVTASQTRVFAPNPWVRIAGDGIVTIVIDRSEMGQGVVTSLATLVAEELEVNPGQIRTEFAPADPVYNNRLFDEQTTGGSTSVRAAWKHLREAGAGTREMLIRAAAEVWSVPRNECRAEKGTVYHAPSGRRLGYGELVDQATKLPVPQDVPLKPPDQWRLIGRSVPRIEVPDMVMGRAQYSLDVALPGMLYAAVARCPVIGGRVASIDASRAVKKDVHRVLEITSGIAVVAESFWSALQGRNALDVTWDDGSNVGLSTAAICQRFRRAAEHHGKVKREEGNVERALSEAVRRVEAVYETPYLAHAPLEPMNCTADVRKDGCDIWVGTQGQQGVRKTAARITGLPEDAIRVHTTYLGGGFGRRLEQDFVAEAVEISKAIGAPVQVVWTREDDMRHGSFRPASYTVLRAGLDDSGMPVAWYQKTVGPDLALNGIDIPYAIPHIRDERVEEDPGVPTGAWRSVGASQNAFAVEGFIDELAHAAGRDPLELRLALLAHSPRHQAVLTLAAEKAGWGKRLPEGHHHGIAVYHSFASWCAQIAEVSIAEDGTVKVHRVVCAIDCGTVVNPDTVASQMEGSIVFGLSAALKGEITIEGGRVQQKSYEDYPIVTLAEMPEAEIYIVPNREPPGGVGEPGVPPVAPAIANAIFAATGRRLRRLPLRIS